MTDELTVDQAVDMVAARLHERPRMYSVMVRRASEYGEWSDVLLERAYTAADALVQVTTREKDLWQVVSVEPA